MPPCRSHRIKDKQLRAAFVTICTKRTLDPDLLEMRTAIPCIIEIYVDSLLSFPDNDLPQSSDARSQVLLLP
jgi:hypothetical protein